MEWSDKKEPVRLRHYLEVRGPPSVYPQGAEDAGSAVVVREGRDNATLSCKAEGIPTPTVEWVREGRLKSVFVRKCLSFWRRSLPSFPLPPYSAVSPYLPPLSW